MQAYQNIHIAVNILWAYLYTLVNNTSCVCGDTSYTVGVSVPKQYMLTFKSQRPLAAVVINKTAGPKEERWRYRVAVSAWGGGDDQMGQ